MHGMLMSPAEGGAGGAGSSGGGRPKPKTPTGTVHPAVAPNTEQTISFDTPIPVVLTHRTLLKLIGVTVGPLIIILSGAAYFFHATRSHIADPVVHLERGERSKLQTKAGCDANVQKLATEIKREVRLNYKEVVVQQKEEIQKVGKELEATQRESLTRILREVKKGHRGTRAVINATEPPPP